MKKVYIQNLGMIVTEACNLDCAHCLRGKICNENSMSDEVIETTLNQVAAVVNLTICGGEPTLALDRIEKILTYIIDNHIIVEFISLTINGTIYNYKLIELLDYIDKYINTLTKNDKSNSFFMISYDKYHHTEIQRKGLLGNYLDNIKMYAKSIHYGGLREYKGKLFREGNAENLDPKLTIPYRPIENVITYQGKNGKFDLENGFCVIGPLVTIGVDGTITECDASNEHQKTLYNYGNVLTDSIEDVFLKRNCKILKPNPWYRKTKRLIYKYETYNK